MVEGRSQTLRIGDNSLPVSAAWSGILLTTDQCKYRVGGQQRQFSYKRSSKVGYLADREPGIARAVSRRIEMLTSYNVVNNHMDRDRQSSEDFQVTDLVEVTKILPISASTSTITLVDS